MDNSCANFRKLLRESAQSGGCYEQGTVSGGRLRDVVEMGQELQRCGQCSLKKLNRLEKHRLRQF